MTTADKKNEVQENVVRSLIQFKILTCVCFTGMAKHVEGNMIEQGKNILHCFVIVSATHSSVAIKAATNFSDRK